MQLVLQIYKFIIMYINSVAVPLQWLLTIDLWQVRRGACSASVCARLAGWWQDATRALPLALPLSSQQCSWQSAPAGVRCFVRERADMALADARFTDLGVGRFMCKEADTVEFGDWHHELRDAPLHMWHSKVRATMAGDLTDGRGDALPAITITSPASVPTARPLGAQRAQQFIACVVKYCPRAWYSRPLSPRRAAPRLTPGPSPMVLSLPLPYS